MNLEKHTVGVGDRFAHQGRAQLRAVRSACETGLAVRPVWNKSNREHAIIGSQPGDLRAEADAAVTALGWRAPYFVDADHIGLKTVDGFLDACDFYTLDVADFTGQAAAEADLSRFVTLVRSHGEHLSIPGIAAPFDLGAETVRATAAKFLLAVQEAGAYLPAY